MVNRGMTNMFGRKACGVFKIIFIFILQDTKHTIWNWIGGNFGFGTVKF